MEAVRYFSSVINGRSTAELQYLFAVTIYSNNNYYNYIRTSNNRLSNLPLGKFLGQGSSIL